MLYCIFCGEPKEFFCRPCGENKLVTAAEFKEYTGEWPDDNSEEQAYYDELNRGYSQDRI